MRVPGIGGLLGLSLTAGLTVGCGGAGPYGHAPYYAPLASESHAVEAAREYDPVMAERRPEEWRKQAVSLFGVVVGKQPKEANRVLLKLSVRTLEPRNLCENERDDDSCRVTVSDRAFGTVFAEATLAGDELVGSKSVGLQSLVRIVGTLEDKPSRDDRVPVVRVEYLRHWPAYTWVTKAAAVNMRQ